MCGIVGYIGDNHAVPVLLDGLQKLEYRGYDSAGIAVCAQSELIVRKKKGRLNVLSDSLAHETIEGTVGIGHTRWATHGAPADMNAHPHTNAADSIAIVHNGIIDNHVKLKEWLSTRGYSFQSQTDTEVIVHLIDYYYRDCKKLLEAVGYAVRRLSGSYALCVLAKDCPDEIICVRKDSPLVIGIGKGENFIASDIPALLKYTRNVYFLEDDEMAIVTRGGVDIVDGYGLPVFRDVFHVDWEVEAAEKAGYPHFMLKEIHEEPKALKDAFFSRLGENGIIDLSASGITEDFAKTVSRVVIVACGTAYHAGLVAKYAIERLLALPTEVDIASEYRYRSPIVKESDLFVVISQSGETADTLAALRLAKKKGGKILGVVNAVGSTIARESDHVIYTMAGPEIAVASTKAYVTQLISLTMLMLELGRLRGDLSLEEYQSFIADLKQFPDQVQSIIENDEKIMRAAHLLSSADNMFFIGRNMDYAIAMEGALKLKEISYIHSEAYAAGELKHGPIALIEEGTVVVAFATQPELFEKTASNIKEVKARGAHVLAICTKDAQFMRDIVDDMIALPQHSPLFMPMLAVIPAQLFAYYCAVERGFDVDKPRNLAKSVTVE